MILAIAKLLPVVAAIVALLGEWLSGESKRRKEVIEDAKTDIEEGIAKRDPSRITRGFDRIKRGL